MLASCVLTASRTDRGTLDPLSPSLALCLLFLSSTRFIESISASKYPRGYATYRARVSMFVPVLAPVWARNVLA
ncbi:hypothetical protein BC826DRAFT_1006200, partial [Russula brevipes]